MITGPEIATFPGATPTIETFPDAAIRDTPKAADDFRQRTIEWAGIAGHAAYVTSLYARTAAIWWPATLALAATGRITGGQPVGAAWRGWR